MHKINYLTENNLTKLMITVFSYRIYLLSNNVIETVDPLHHLHLRGLFLFTFYHPQCWFWRVIYADWSEKRIMSQRHIVCVRNPAQRLMHTKKEEGFSIRENEFSRLHNLARIMSVLCLPMRGHSRSFSLYPTADNRNPWQLNENWRTLGAVSMKRPPRGLQRGFIEPP